ncbi:MAG TPA: NmrA family NAD(P)-binding protein [Vicinamibacterales bacterium]|jgi:uncharacterized protein YbjT (DUF2867 family)
MKVLIIGGTGTVGHAVLEKLLADGHQPTVMTRSTEKAARQPAPAVVADLEKPATLSAAFTDVEAVFLAATVSPTETTQSLAAVEAARAAGVQRIVYLSVAMPPGSDVIPHFASKIPVERSIQASGIPWTILRPNNFFQNDLWLRDPIAKHGVYPQPLGGRGCNRVDVRDIADAAANAFTKGISGLFPLHGPRGLTGDDTARVYSEALGRPVRYAGDDLEAWAQQASTMFPPWMVHDFRIMYDYFITHGLLPSGRDFAAQEQVLGHAPRTFERFVAELAPDWKKLVQA